MFHHCVLSYFVPGVCFLVCGLGYLVLVPCPVVVLPIFFVYSLSCLYSPLFVRCLFLMHNLSTFQIKKKKKKLIEVLRKKYGYDLDNNR